MTISELLNLDPVTCIEPSFADLTDGAYTAFLLALEADAGLLIVDEQEEIIALALHSDDAWIAGSFVCRPPVREIIEKMEHLDLEIYQEPRDVWTAALREYYNSAIIHDFQPGIEDTREERFMSVRTLIDELWGKSSPAQCIDCCCGSGIGSSVLRDRGIAPLSYDNDPALLALGFSTGRLFPKETMWIDGTFASRYISPVEAGIGLMLGDIAPFNAGMWEQIVGELLAITGETVVTVATERELGLVAGWCRDRGREVEWFENDRDPIYDRWVCIAQPS
jgi:hypothetical protein